eukprot:TRINITY_DN2102_c3_g1_i3.p1 TRINITY_DN2102_c3_g1~~TRINITY_DN2102_c3_g1_i3.p1  ORF type:complete len:1174 (-),score=110.39 TRINITY_DN2102_c3_g1_i3:8998-12444(-)
MAQLPKLTIDWIKAAQSHELFYPSEIKPASDDGASFNSFIFLINSVKGLELPPPVKLPKKNVQVVGQSYEMKLICTVLHKAHLLFGRTYASNPIPLSIFGSYYQTTLEDYLYLATPFDADTLELVIELVVYEKLPRSPPIKSTLRSIGWTSLIVPRDKHTHSAQLHKGSPRLLYLDAFKRAGEVRGKIEYQCSQIVMPVELHKVIPINCICGPADSFPGIFDYHLPKDAMSFLETGIKEKAEVQILPTVSIFLNNCVLRVPEGFEAKLLEDYKNVTKCKKVTIHERRLNVGAHNQWKFINSAKNKNSITLSLDPPYLQCNGILIVDSIYLCEGIALIFELEYALRAVKAGGGDEIKYVGLGEFVQPLSYSRLTRNFEKIEIDEELNADTESRLTDRPMWCPYENMIQSSEWKVKLHCEVSSSQGAVADERTKERIKMLEERKKLEEIRNKKMKEIQKIEQEKEAELKRKESMLAVKERELLKRQERSIKAVENPATPTKVLESLNLPQEELKTPEATKPPIDSEIMESAGKPPPPDLVLLERSDPLKASTVFVSFLSYIPTVHDLELNKVPRRLCFSLKFFTFPVTHSPGSTLRPGTWSLELGKPVGTWTNTASKDEQGQVIKIQYDFDPSLDPDMPSELQVEEFAKYLAVHRMKIWVWDADSLFLIGHTWVDLSDLMRKGKPSVVVDKECTVIGMNKEIMGKIQLKLTNLGRMIGEIKRDPLKSFSQVSRGKTKIRSKPITKKDLSKLPEVSQTIQKTSEDDLRKSQMVMNYRMREGKSLDSLNENVEKYRELSRTLVFSHMLDKSVKKHTTTITYLLGQLILYPIQFVNPEKTEATFAIEIIDPEAPHNEIEVVKDPDEWRFFCAKENIEAPADWHKFDSNGNLSMKGKEQVVLLLKILAVAKPSRPNRTFRISMRNLADNLVTYRKDTLLQYKETYYNGTAVIVAPEKKPVDVPIQSDIPGELLAAARRIVCNNPAASISLNEGRVNANFVTPSAPLDSELLFFVFGDNYCYETLYIMQVVVKSYKLINLNQVAGYYSGQILEVMCEHARQAEVHTNDKEVVEINSKLAGVMLIKEGEVVKMPVKIGSLKVGKSDTLIHCIGNYFLPLLSINRLQDEGNSQQMASKTGDKTAEHNTAVQHNRSTQ